MIDGKLVFCPECGTIDIVEGISMAGGVYFIGCPDCDVWLSSPIDPADFSDGMIMYGDIERNLNSLRRQWTAND